MGVRASGLAGSPARPGSSGSRAWVLVTFVALNSTVRLRAQHNWANCQKPAKYSTRKIREIDGS